jgi:hypothetical protein
MTSIALPDRRLCRRCVPQKHRLLMVRLAATITWRSETVRCPGSCGPEQGGSNSAIDPNLHGYTSPLDKTRGRAHGIFWLRNSGVNQSIETGYEQLP